METQKRRPDWIVNCQPYNFFEMFFLCWIIAQDMESRIRLFSSNLWVTLLKIHGDIGALEIQYCVI
jgi:hypothetical protein